MTRDGGDCLRGLRDADPVTCQRIKVDRAVFNASIKMLKRFPSG